MLDILRDFLVYNISFLQGIFDRIDQILAFWTFLAIGLVCGGFVIATFVLGEVSDFFGDLFGHDGDFSLGDHGGFDHDLLADSGHDIGHSDVGHGDMPSILSFRIILIFFAGFGIAGAISMQLGNGIIASSGYGVLIGFVMGLILYGFMLFLATSQGSVNITDNDIIGQDARVIVRIPADGGLGQIQLETICGTLTKLSRSVDNRPIPENSLVKVQSIVGQVAVVRAE